jgi:hypothetical protein
MAEGSSISSTSHGGGGGSSDPGVGTFFPSESMVTCISTDEIDLMFSCNLILN